MLSKMEAAQLIALGIESESSPVIIKGEMLNLKVSISQNGVSLTFDNSEMGTEGEEIDEEADDE